MSTITTATSIAPFSYPSLEHVCRSIRNWNTALKYGNGALMKRLMENYNSFTIPVEMALKNSGEGFHVYMGITDECLEFFLIDKAKDKIETIRSLDSDECIVAQIPATHVELEKAKWHYNILSPQEALRRIENWRNNKGNWIDRMYTDGKPFFQAWEILPEDLNQLADCPTYFGLADSDGGFEPDLVINYANDGTFHDLVRPVPPFKYGEMPDFQLLMHALAGHS